MHYRQMKAAGEEVSALGFGCMRFPIEGDEREDIKTRESAEMLDYAIENGVNYLDTAWFYHGGESENFLGDYLQQRSDREDLYIATKLPSPLIEEKKDLDYYLEKQLEKLQVDYIDFYLLHALTEKRWTNLKEFEVTEWLLQKREEGLIKHLGFSFHDEYPVFKEIIDHFSGWDFCQIQYNYLDKEYQAGEKGLEYAHEKGLDVIVMEPLRGGLLARKPPREIKEIWSESSREISPAARALEWLWDDERISLVLSGMTQLEEVMENVSTAARSEPGQLPESELELVEKAAKKMKELQPVNCTGCNYCVPCPEDVSIPRIFDYYNQAHIYENFAEMQESYNKIDEEKNAAACIQCQVCEDKCPQNLNISQLMPEIESYFSND